MKVDLEVLTDVRKGEMFAICLNDTLVRLESQEKKGKKKKSHPATILEVCELLPKAMLGLRACLRVSGSLFLCTNHKKDQQTG